MKILELLSNLVRADEFVIDERGEGCFASKTDFGGKKAGFKVKDSLIHEYLTSIQGQSCE